MRPILNLRNMLINFSIKCTTNFEFKKHVDNPFDFDDLTKRDGQIWILHQTKYPQIVG